MNVTRQSVNEALNKSIASNMSKDAGTTAKQGIKKPSQIQDISSKIKDTLNNGVKSAAQKAIIKRNMPAGPVSAETDEVDEIYKEEDPIEVSVGMRKKAGSL
jgi:hypothetical protein